MSFILVSTDGEELQVNAWNWRPTLVLLLEQKLLDAERYELLGAHGCGVGLVDQDLARRIGDGLDRWLQSANFKPGQRLLADLTITNDKKVPVVFSPADQKAIDSNDLYSTTYEWLVAFRDFCRRSNGFDVY